MSVDRGKSPAVRNALRLAKARAGPAAASDRPVSRKLPRVLPGQLDLFGGGSSPGGGAARRRRYDEAAGADG
jgi:hypothetical protein